jgi:BON domain
MQHVLNLARRGSRSRFRRRRFSGTGGRRAANARVARARAAARRSPPVLAAATGGAGLTYFFDPQLGKGRRKRALQRTGGFARRRVRRAARVVRHTGSGVRGLGRKATHPRWTQSAPADDITLAHKVETEIFRPVGAPKGSVDVNAVDGVVWLRGQVGRLEQMRELEERARHVVGVKEVRNLLHLPGTPPRTDTPSRPSTR